MTKAPIWNIPPTKLGTYKWRCCPYSTSDATDRVPDGEKALHPVTSGWMSMDIRGGHDNVGFVCLDPYCPFFLGTASTPVIMKVRVQKLNRETGQYWVEIEEHEIPVCSGTYFWEK